MNPAYFLRAMRIIKRQVWQGQFQTLHEAWRLAVDELVVSMDTEDFREGVASVMEKRAPKFTGR